MKRAARDVGIDVARGLAVLLMFQTHAYDGWVQAASRATAGYRLTRELGAIPAPLFLLLAGVGVALGEKAGPRRFVQRGLQVFGAGYLVSLAYGVIDTSYRPEVLLRADILHAIGLSVALSGAVLVGRRHAVRTALAIALLATCAQPLWAASGLAPAPRGLSPWLAAPLSLLVDVPGWTRFPLLPLVAFPMLGFVATRLGGAWLMAPQRATPVRLVLLAGALGLGAAGLDVLTAIAVHALGGALTRAHPAVVLNVLDGTCRAASVVCLGVALARATPPSRGALLEPLVRLGSGSLLAYAVHIPLCYGRLARPIARALDLPQATVALLALSVFTYAVVRVRDGARKRLKAT